MRSAETSSSELASWLSDRAGLSGIKLNAALKQCNEQLVESLDDLELLREQEKLPAAFPQPLLHMAIEKALAKGVASNEATLIDLSQPVWITAEGPRRIELSLTISQVGAIDTKDETCTARLWIDAYWLPSREELEKGVNEWEVLGNFQLTNATDVRISQIIKEPTLKDKNSCKKWHSVIELAGTFKQQFDLHKFPLDCQSLVVSLEMGNIRDMVYCAADQAIVLSVERDLCPLTGWAWLGASINFTSSDPALSKQGNSYAQAIVEFKLAREWKPYLWRVVLFTMGVMWSSCLVFLMDPVDAYGDRLNFLFTLMLSMVAFQFVIKDWLPMSSYSTLLERYVLLCLSLVFVDLIECVIVKLYLERKTLLLYFSDDLAADASANATVTGSSDGSSEGTIPADHLGMWIQLFLLAFVHLALGVYCMLERHWQVQAMYRVKTMPPSNNLKIRQEMREIIKQNGVQSSVFTSMVNVGDTGGGGGDVCCRLRRCNTANAEKQAQAQKPKEGATTLI